MREPLVPVLIPLSEMELLGKALYEIARDAEMPRDTVTTAKRAHKRLYEAVEQLKKVIKEGGAG